MGAKCGGAEMVDAGRCYEDDEKAQRLTLRGIRRNPSRGQMGEMPGESGVT